jgi:hypothetical protein
MSFWFNLFIYLAAFFGVAAFFVADFGFDAFFAAGFLAAVDFGFFAVVAFLTFGLAAFFVAGFFAPAGLAAVVFFAFVDFVALADFGVALDFGFDALAIVTFFGLAAVVETVVGAAVAVAGVAELFVAAGVATFLADFVPADFERGRFFVPDDAELDDAGFFAFLVDFFFAGFPPSANLNEPLAPLPFVCLNDLDLTPFLRANLRC